MEYAGAGFIFLLFFTYFGLLVGIIISNFSKEEIENGKKYFRVLKSLIFLVVLSLFFIHLNIPYLAAAFVSFLISSLLFLWERKITRINTEILYYSFFSVVLYETINLSPAYVVLIFLYGIPAASLKYENISFLRNAWNVISGNAIYLALSLCFLIFRTW
jgi:hypothetical protein